MEVVGTEHVPNKTAGGWTAYILRVTPRGGGPVYLVRHRYSEFVRLHSRLVTAGGTLPPCWGELEAESRRNLVQLLYSTERARRGRCELITRCFGAAAAADPGFTQHALVRRFLRPQPQPQRHSAPQSAPTSPDRRSRAGGGRGSGSGNGSGSVSGDGGGVGAEGVPIAEQLFSLTEDSTDGAAGTTTVDAVSRTGNGASTASAEGTGASVKLLMYYPPDRSVADTLRNQVTRGRLTLSNPR